MNADPYDLQRFVAAQEDSYPQALAELRAGHKHGHWIWFIFPQIKGLGSSPTAEFYAIQSSAEAAAYLEHVILGPRLAACAAAVLSHAGKTTAAEIFGFPDDLKLRSSVTLFATVPGADPVFPMVLEQFFQNLPDARTLDALAS